MNEPVSKCLLVLACVVLIPYERTRIEVLAGVVLIPYERTCIEVPASLQVPAC